MYKYVILRYLKVVCIFFIVLVDFFTEQWDGVSDEQVSYVFGEGLIYICYKQWNHEWF